MTTTPNISIVLPTNNADADIWGTELNTALTLIDAIFSASTGTAISLKAPTFVTPALGTPASGVLTNCSGYTVANVSGLGTGVATALAVNTGTAGSYIVNGGALGTPSGGTLTNCTGLPIGAGISGLGTGVATFLATPTSANLAAALTDETGSGANVFASAPTLSNPVVGTQSAGDNSTKAASTAYVDSLSGSGTWSPTDQSGAGLTFPGPLYYRKMPGFVLYWGQLLFPTTANGTNAVIGGLPFTCANLGSGDFPGTANFGGGTGTPGGAAPSWSAVQKNSTNLVLRYQGGTQMTNVQLSTYTIYLSGAYPI